MAGYVIAGTYERTLCGYMLGDAGDFTAIFNQPAHLGPVKAVASSGRFMVSGGSDEEIRVFNLRKRVEVGSIMQHNGPVTCLRFWETSHLFSGSDDSDICVWKTKEWDCLAKLQGHRAGVIDLDVHHTGKVLLSCSKDKSIRLWDLVKARCIHATNGQDVMFIKWGPGGDAYCAAAREGLRMFSTEAGATNHTFHGARHPKSAASP